MTCIKSVWVKADNAIDGLIGTTTVCEGGIWFIGIFCFREQNMRWERTATRLIQ